MQNKHSEYIEFCGYRSSILFIIDIAPQNRHIDHQDTNRSTSRKLILKIKNRIKPITQKKSFTEIKANQNGALWYTKIHHFGIP